MFMLNSSEPIKVVHLQKVSQSINAERHTCKIQFFQWKLKKLWSFDKTSNALIEKNRDMGSEKYVLLDFAKYLSFSEVKKNIVNV